MHTETNKPYVLFIDKHTDMDYNSHWALNCYVLLFTELDSLYFMFVSVGTQPGDQPSLVAFVTQLSNPEYLSP